MPGRLLTVLEDIGKRRKDTYDHGDNHDYGKSLQEFFLVPFGHEFYYTK